MTVWRLRSYLAGLLVATMLLTFVIVGGGILLLRIPQIEQASKEEVARDVREMSVLVKILLGALESRMEVLGQTLPSQQPQASALLDRSVGDGAAFRAIYLVSAHGKVLAAGVSAELRPRREALLGSDLSANALFHAAQASGKLVWGDKYLSALSGAATVGLAYPVGEGQVLLAEVPLVYLLSTFQLAVGQRASSIWLVDRRGEILADSDGGMHVGTANVLNVPLMAATLKGQPLPERFNFGGRHFHPAVARSQDLDWYFVGGMPADLENPEIRGTVLFVLGGLAGALLVSLLMAPFWASRLTRPLRGIVDRAEEITRGAAGGAWPRGSIAEFNHLSADLEQMASALQEREQKTQAIFNASPVPMSVTDTSYPYPLLDVNEAWCRVFDRRRESVLGRTAADFGLWRSAEDRAAMLARLAEGHATADAWMLRGDGQAVLCQVSRRQAQVGASSLMVWAAVDLTDMRRVDDALRELNSELEARVERRTEALATANEELSGAVASLRETQGELVRVEKMAALGGLVAGVAHELNTPLGNGLLAVTALADETRQFRLNMQHGLRRNALQALLESVEQGTSIATRNLHRAADLVTSFKQVAVDQTTAQRRRFELREVVDEMVASLRPTFARTSYRIVVEVPAGLRLDSYPGALGQAIGNLVNNAVLHGFEGRAHGCILITGARSDDGSIVLRVADDGHGIPAALLNRIFDPFVTTKMGRGGTGLGLHITYNAVVNVLGGSLTVQSEEGQGTAFELRLPDNAPRTAPVAS